MKTKLTLLLMLVGLSAYAQSTISKGTFIYDPVTTANQAKVQTAAPASADAGLTVRNIPTPQTAGGLSTFHLESAASTNATVIKASIGQVFGWYIYNSNAAARKVAFHNTTTTPTAGAGIFFTLIIPPGSAANVFTETGIAFSSGIAITTVTGLPDNNASAVAADDLNINIFYK